MGLLLLLCAASRTPHRGHLCAGLHADSSIPPHIPSCPTPAHCCVTWRTLDRALLRTIWAPLAQGGVRALPPPLVTSLPAGIMTSPVQHSLFLLGHLQAPGWGHSPGACDSSCPQPCKGDKHGNNPQGGGEGSLGVAGSPFPGKAKAVTEQGDLTLGLWVQVIPLQGTTL